MMTIVQKKKKGKGGTGTAATAATRQEKPQHTRYLKNFRVEQCKDFVNGTCLNTKPFKCFYWHYPNQRRRRNVIGPDGYFNYSSDVYCNLYDEKKGACPGGDGCRFLHKVVDDTEKTLHLRYYKTRLCFYDFDEHGVCKRHGLHCTNAHGDDDLRKPVFDLIEKQKRDVIRSTTLPAQISDEWKDPNYTLIHFKTNPCPKKSACRPTGCPYYHSSCDRRRSPISYKYYANPCPSVRKDKETSQEWGNPDRCQYKDKCQFCHTISELIFHPLVYKTIKCKRIELDGACAHGSLCSFYHFDEESSQIRRKIFPSTTETMQVGQVMLKDPRPPMPLAFKQYSFNSSPPPSYEPSPNCWKLMEEKRRIQNSIKQVVNTPTREEMSPSVTPRSNHSGHQDPPTILDDLFSQDQNFTTSPWGESFEDYINYETVFGGDVSGRNGVQEIENYPDFEIPPEIPAPSSKRVENGVPEGLDPLPIMDNNMADLLVDYLNNKIDRAVRKMSSMTSEGGQNSDDTDSGKSGCLVQMGGEIKRRKRRKRKVKVEESPFATMVAVDDGKESSRTKLLQKLSPLETTLCYLNEEFLKEQYFNLRMGVIKKGGRTEDHLEGFILGMLERALDSYSNPHHRHYKCLLCKEQKRDFTLKCRHQITCSRCTPLVALCECVVCSNPELNINMDELINLSLKLKE